MTENITRFAAIGGEKEKPMSLEAKLDVIVRLYEGHRTVTEEDLRYELTTDEGADQFFWRAIAYGTGDDDRWMAEYEEAEQR